MTGEPLLSVADLGVTFSTAGGPVVAVRDVSFDLAHGEVLGIVGESGSGKTVACRSIVRLLPRAARIVSGSIRYDGRELTGLTDDEMIGVRGEKIAMIFQNPSTHLDPLMPVGQQIAEALRFHRGVSSADARKAAIALLRDVRIAEPETRCDAYPHELSGGMRQRVMIASALACRPDILIADEPTTALDVTVQAEILRLLVRLRREHAFAMIMVSHDLGVIAETCDRVIVMRDGQVVEAGPISEVLDRPQAAYTRRLIASQPALMARQSAPSPGPSSSQPHGPILALQDVTIRFGSSGGLLGGRGKRSRSGVTAVDGVSLSIGAGTTLGIVGESGSGKSTIARAIVGLVTPNSGQIVFKGRAVGGLLSGEERSAYPRAVQMVFQDPYTALNPRFTVFRTLAEPLRVHELCPRREIPDRVAELLRVVELAPDLMHRYSGQLSGGQRQRVGIARALAMRPEVIIADEVTSALDVTIQAQILELFQRLKAEMQLTLVLISHDLGVVRHLSDHVAVLQRGRLVEYGSVHEVLERPRESYTRTLLDSIPSLARGLAGARAVAVAKQA